MQGFANIGTIYSLREKPSDKSRIWIVIENNSNDKTSTLLVIEECPEKGKKVVVDANWLYEREPIGPILLPSGEIVIKDGIEFVKPVEEKTQSKELIYKSV